MLGREYGNDPPKMPFYIWQSVLKPLLNHRKDLDPIFNSSFQESFKLYNCFLTQLVSASKVSHNITFHVQLNPIPWRSISFFFVNLTPEIGAQNSSVLRNSDYQFLMIIVAVCKVKVLVVLFFISPICPKFSELKVLH